MTLREKIKKQILVNGRIEIYELNVKNWPTITDEDGVEELDLENYSILELTEDKLVMTAGGDWQEYDKKLEITLVDGEPTVTALIDTDFSEEELTEEEFIRILTQ